MAFDAGSAVAKLILDSKEWASGAAEAVKHNESLMGSMFKAQVAFELFNKAVEKVTEAIKEGINGAIEEQKIMKQTETVIKSTGMAAGMTAQQIADLAESLSKNTTLEDEAIQTSENLLLTFTSIGKDVFPEATQAIIDMSAAMHEDLQSATIQIGKALQDPILGVTALRRVGVNFNETQKEIIKYMIQSGHTMQAQKLILTELEKEFGGSAKAARDTFGGAITALNRDIGDTEKIVGRYIINAGRPFVEMMDKLVLSVQNWLNSKDGVIAIVNILSQAGGYLSAAGAGIKIFVDEISKMGTSAFTSVTNSMKTFGGAGQDLNPIFLGVAVVMEVVFFKIKAITEGIKVAAATITLVKDTVDIFTGEAKKKTEALIAEAAQKNNEIMALYTKGQITKAEADARLKTIKALTDEATRLNEYYSNTTTRYMDTVGKSIDELVDKAVHSGEDVKKIMGEMNDAYKKGMDDFNKNTKSLTAGIIGGTTGEGEKKEGAATPSGPADPSDFYDMERQAEVDNADFVNKIRDDNKKKEEERWKQLVEEIKSYTDEIGSFAADSIGKLSQLNDNSYDKKLIDEDKDYAKKKKDIENNVKDETQKKAQLDALEEAHTNKVNELKRKQFEDDRFAKEAQVAIETAVKIVEAFPDPVKMTLAGITGALEEAVIMTQANPYYMGGIAEGWAAVGERGPELAYFANPTKIYSNEESRKIMSPANGGDFVVNNYNATNLDLESEMRESYYKYKAYRGKV